MSWLRKRVTDSHQSISTCWVMSEMPWLFLVSCPCTALLHCDLQWDKLCGLTPVTDFFFNLFLYGGGQRNMHFHEKFLGQRAFKLDYQGLLRLIEKGRCHCVPAACWWFPIFNHIETSLHIPPPPSQFLTARTSSKIINSCSCPSLFFMDLRSSLFFQMPTQSQRWLIPGLGMRLTLWWWKERAPVSTSTTCWDRRWDKKQSNRAQVSHWSGRRRSPHFVIFHTLTRRRYQFHF